MQEGRKKERNKKEHIRTVNVSVRFYSASAVNFCFIKWALNLVYHCRGNHRLRVFENIVLRRKFGLQKEELTNQRG
jgi:hypothetical protein